MKTMKFFMTYMMVVALVVFASCKKDNLQDAVLPENTVAENTTNSAGGTNGTNGTNGSNGVDGTNGTNGTNGDDGEDGEDGEDGQDGVDGQDGADGEDGADGQDGATGPKGDTGATGPKGDTGATGPKGPKGDDGADGNANVKVYKYDISSASGNTHFQSVPPINAEVVNKNYVVLGYIERINLTYPLPARVQNEFFITSTYKIGSYRLSFYTVDGSAKHDLVAGNLKKLKVVIIKPTSVTGKSNEASVRAELKSNGVDINDYSAVMDYYGLDY